MILQHTPHESCEIPLVNLRPFDELKISAAWDVGRTEFRISTPVIFFDRGSFSQGTSNVVPKRTLDVGFMCRVEIFIYTK
jgi:hypothetical protein